MHYNMKNIIFTLLSFIFVFSGCCKKEDNACYCPKTVTVENNTANSYFLYVTNPYSSPQFEKIIKPFVLEKITVPCLQQNNVNILYAIDTLSGNQAWNGVCDKYLTIE